MLRRIVFATILAALIVACRPDPGPAAGAPAALPVPDAFQGAWYVGQSCGDVGSYFFRGDGWWVAIAEQADQRTIVAQSSAFSVLQVEQDGAVVVSAYWRDPAKDEYVPARFKLTPAGAKLAGSQLEGSYTFPPAATSVPRIFEIRCDQPEVAGKPWPLASRYLADLTAILGAASAIQHACSSGPRACAGAIIAALDLNQDGKVSPAELVSFLRRASKVGFLAGKTVPGTSMVRATFTLDQVGAAELGAASIGPIFVPIVMANVDYNGDGFIEEDELETLLHQIGVPPVPGTFTGLILSAKSGADQAARSLGALQQLLGGH
ncbi:MAG: hypothetical protein ACREFJ_01720 [Acetobacteraceae bacterium]